MDSEEEKIIVNIKGISAKSWERAKISSGKSGETLGQWISRAAEQLANLETGQRLFAPDKLGAIPANHPRVPEVDFREIAAVLVAMKEAGLVTQRRVGTQINRLLHAQLKEANRGLKNAQDVKGITLDFP